MRSKVKVDRCWGNLVDVVRCERGITKLAGGSISGPMRAGEKVNRRIAIVN